MDAIAIWQSGPPEFQHGKWLQVIHDATEGGIGPECLEDFLQDQARQRDILIAHQQSRELPDTGMVCRPPLPQGK
jgi:hypothetical protein